MIIALSGLVLGLLISVIWINKWLNRCIKVTVINADRIDLLSETLKKLYLVEEKYGTGTDKSKNRRVRKPLKKR